MKNVSEQQHTLARIALTQANVVRTPEPPPLREERPTQRPPALYRSLTEMFPTVGIVAMVVAATLGGCAATPEDGTVKAETNIQSNASKLQASDIVLLLGKYSGCSGHAEGDPWKIGVSGGFPTTLAVKKNDVSCLLLITQISTLSNDYISVVSAGSSSSKPFSIGTAWSSIPILFSDATNFSAGPQFYGNAKMSAADYQSDFVINLLFGDDPKASNGGSVTGHYKTVTGTVVASKVLAPDYTTDLSAVTVNEDVNNIVTDVAGWAQLTAGVTAGQDVAVYSGALTSASTLTQVSTAWSASTPVTIASLTTGELPTSAFNLVGVDLNTNPQRTIIVRNTQNAVSSYQVILVTFAP